jgi:hypothetical protein
MRYLKAALIGLFMALFMVGTAAASTVDEVTPVGPDAAAVDAILNIPPYIVATFMGAIVPLIIGYLTKPTHPAWVKIGGNAVLTLLVGIITVATVDGGGAIISWSTLSAAVIAWVSSGVTFGRVWVPFHLTSRPGDKLATVGVK